MKNLFKKSKKADLVAPRELDAIKAELGQVLAQLGNERYQIYYHESEVDRLNQVALRLNQEGGARLKLNDEAAKALAAKQSAPEAQNVQS